MAFQKRTWEVYNSEAVSGGSQEINSTWLLFPLANKLQAYIQLIAIYQT